MDPALRFALMQSLCELRMMKLLKLFFVFFHVWWCASKLERNEMIRGLLCMELRCGVFQLTISSKAGRLLYEACFLSNKRTCVIL